MKTIEQIFGRQKIVPTVTIEDPELALPIAEVLLSTNIKVMAIRILSRKSLASITKIVRGLPQMIVGAAGTMDAAGFLNASLAGAEFISSPGVTPELLTAARTRFNSAHFLPGAITPSHLMDIFSRGIEVVNIFPAEIFNGYELIKSYAHTFPKGLFAVSGGITMENMTKYLQLSNVVAVGMSSIASSKLVVNRDFNEIRLRAEQAVAIVESALASAKADT